MWQHFRTGVFAVALTASPAMIHAAEIAVALHEVTKEGISNEIGQMRFEDSEYGLLIKADLHGLPSGPHAPHVHENPDCGPVERDGKLIPAGAAGGHYDPHKTGRSESPYGEGALGDLPNLIVEKTAPPRSPPLRPVSRSMTCMAARSWFMPVRAAMERVTPVTTIMKSPPGVSPAAS